MVHEECWLLLKWWSTPAINNNVTGGLCSNLATYMHEYLRNFQLYDDASGIRRYQGQMLLKLIAVSSVEQQQPDSRLLVRDLLSKLCRPSYSVRVGMV
jgi:hypothetical protein